MALIEAADLVKNYENDGVVTPVLHSLTFKIEAGEFVAIMGPSGSGKSTLMHILGLLDQPTGGRYLFDGQEVSALSDDQQALVRNLKVGFVFQSFNLLPKTTVVDNVMLPMLYNEQLSKKEKESRALYAIEAVGLSHRLNYFSNQLSGGEKQRVAIARALVNEPAVLFADEPTGNLDSKSGAQIMEILQQQNDHGHTIVLVTHETYTSQHAKRIMRILDGKIVSDELVNNRLLIKNGDQLLK